ncbi:MAG: hypothetical protein EP341_03160 [Sphingomonadales bacterium]|nr:MAG: hypothetical protein EP341_03160 [Sphingomonadales bacterium]
MIFDLEQKIRLLAVNGSWVIDETSRNFRIVCGPVSVQAKPAGREFSIRIGQDLFVSSEMSSPLVNTINKLLSGMKAKRLMQGNDGREQRALSVLDEMEGTLCTD